MNTKHMSMIGVFAFLAGCAAPASPTPDDFASNSDTLKAPESWNDPYVVVPEDARVCSERYQVKIDSRFAPETLNRLVASWEEWKKILGEVFPGEMVVADLSGDQEFQPCVLKIILHDPPPTYLGWTVSWMMNDKKPASSRIWISEGLGEILRQVSLHEIGHFLGVPHSNDPASVMNPASFPNSVITIDDRKQLCSIWGCQ